AGRPARAPRPDRNTAADPASPTPMAAVAVMAAAHSPTTFATSAGGGLGRDQRGGADGGESGRSENRLADHGFFSWFYGDVLAHPGSQSGERSARFNAQQ